ncbi:MAG: PadR family transcriptional regulator, partial [Bacteroidota bacterium]
MDSIGNLEEMVLLVVMSMDKEAYGVSIHATYVDLLQQSITLSAIHTVLRRLEKKGFISSTLGGSTSTRGGRRKRLYHVTQEGARMVQEL